MASASTISYGANKDPIQPMIKAHFSGKLVSSGISDLAIASVYSEEELMMKMMMMMYYYD